MAISKLFKKETAPEELPDLAIDELKKDLKKDFSEKEETKTEKKKEESQKPKEEEIIEKPQKEEEKEEETPIETTEKKEEKTEEQGNSNESKKNSEDTPNLEKSFFNPLITELKKENFDASKIDGWYQRTFSDKSAIEWMKEYWEKQKDEFITESIEKEFKKRISEKMVSLQKLEAEWQEIYINLIKKEEEMKKEEKDIKKTIKEFSEVLRKKGNVKKDSKVQ